MADTPKTEQAGDNAARYFVVELKSGSEPSYAVCERIATFSPGRDGIPPGLVEQSIAARTLRATTLLAEGGGAELARMLLPTVVYAGQTGRSGFAQGGPGGLGGDVNFNVNFENNPQK
ncbi:MULTISPECIES: hypothetical protein [Sphingosinicellaceae]|uniref:hypothetical protein n=1 Tax=Sphingosinicellaceae TaxID=2820280 RepID=UPI001C1E76C9|nr:MULTISPECIES: hypothetical protein [Polymorphobacter]QYE33066.1 hypothetical protein KZX46_02760 [Polymorphobacter sp. PAMC 29334]UAJ12293.1 hypothetical protein KTC28_20950 [Polymorphobacter megasporae]